MLSLCLGEASVACIHSCRSTPFANSIILKPKHGNTTATASCLQEIYFTNHEILPNLSDAFSDFIRAFPHYVDSELADHIRQSDYSHLSSHICLDYSGFSLFSREQLHSTRQTSNSQPPSFNIAYKSASLKSQVRYGNQESVLEVALQKRIMKFLNISDKEYSMVCTANRTAAFRILAESYPFQTNKRLLTVYDHESDAVRAMAESAEKRGARIASTEFSWPSMRIRSEKLMKMVSNKRKKKRGLFVFPPQSQITGARYPYLWMSLAQENGWHVLLDACSLGAKDMNALGLSLIKPDFIVSSFFKVFGENPSGFAGLFIKRSSSRVLETSTVARSIGIVSIVPHESFIKEEKVVEEETGEPSSKIEQSEKSKTSVEIKCIGLDHADSMGLLLISSRLSCLTDWLVNAMMKLKHPRSQDLQPLVKIYGPRIKFDRGPAVAFNLFDWKGERVEPALVQKLADRSNISLSYGFLILV